MYKCRPTRRSLSSIAYTYGIFIEYILENLLFYFKMLFPVKQGVRNDMDVVMFYYYFNSWCMVIFTDLFYRFNEEKDIENKALLIIS